MMHTTININDFDLTMSKIQSLENKLIIIAGASASGKSYFAKKLAEKFRDDGKKVLEVTSDDYYSNTTGLKYMLYGTFDHPNLIEYDKLEKNIKQYLKTGKMEKPIYSFVERRTTDHLTIEGDYDYIIIEGIYTIMKLADELDATKVFVHSEREELIFRRIVRDQSRVSEPTYMIVENIGKAFPMRKIHGEGQKRKADIIIDNDYQILEHQGGKCTYKTETRKKTELGKLIDKKYIDDYVYSDDDPENGDIIISEVYKEKKGLLDHIIISKVKQNGGGEQQVINLKLFQPGVLIQLHTLMQTAGLNMIGTKKRIEVTYENKGKRMTYKEENGILSWKCKVTKKK